MAAVDVYEKEPLRDVNDPLLKMPTMSSARRISAMSRATNTSCSSPIFSTRSSAYAAGKPENVVNPDVMAPAALIISGKCGR